MIENWHYDPGEPQWMEAIQTWSERRTPVWRCKCRYLWKTPEIDQWLSDYCVGEYDSVMRFNGGNPYLSITIRQEADATAFLLRWT